MWTSREIWRRVWRWSNLMLNESKRKRNEILAVTTTGLGKFVFMDFLNWKLPFILFSISAWLLYIIYQLKKNPEVVKQWGFRLDTFWACTRLLLPFGMAAILTFFTIGYFNKTLNLSWNIIPMLILYPAWGIVQQYLVIALWRAICKTWSIEILAPTPLS